MKLLTRLFQLRPAVVIGALPNTLANGQTVDATPLMANFNWIVNQVNAAGLAVTSLTPQLASANTFTGLQSGISATQLANFPIATQIINASLTYCGTSTGTNTITASAAISPGSYAAGQMFSFYAGGANTGAATLNLNGIGAAALVNKDGSALIAGQIPINSLVQVQYDGTSFELISPAKISLTTAVSGILPTANGGTGLSASGASGNILTSNGTAWTSAPNGSAMTLLSTITANNSATVDVETTFSSTYDSYLVIISGATMASDGFSFKAQLKLSGAYVSTNTYQFHIQNSSSAANTYSAQASDLASSITIAQNTGSGAGKSLNAKVTISNPASTTLEKQVYFDGSTITDGTSELAMAHGIGSNPGTGAMTGIRFFASTGNIATGVFRLYGISNS